MATNSEKKEKSLAEFIVIITLVGVMMAVFINYFIKNEDQFTHAGFTTLAQNFNTKVNAVHAQWLMDSQPDIVQLASFNEKEKQAITVNNAGWINVKHPLACEAIWQLIMETPMSLMEFSISAIQVYNSQGNDQSGAKKSVCRYVLLDGSYFQYNRATGKVGKVIKLN
jgi:competence protein ComGC